MTPPPPRFAVIGAGSVGLSLAARLAAADQDVALIARRAESVEAIRAEGIEVYDPASEQRWRARPAWVGTLAAPRDLAARSLIVCVRAPDSEALAAELAAVAPGAPVACAQNDVDNEACFARRFDEVAGVVVRQTCWRTAPHVVHALGSGRLVIGAHPEGTSENAEALVGAFRAADFDVALSERIAEDKWLKLCVNLMSVPNSLIAPSEHTRPEFVEIKARLVEEARDALQAAGIVARSCDGHDRSLDEEIAFQRASVQRGQSARRLAVYNAVWASLDGGGPLEAERYHERILALAETHGIAAPMNRRALSIGLRARREGRRPESSSCAEFLSESSER